MVIENREHATIIANAVADFLQEHGQRAAFFLTTPTHELLSHKERDNMLEALAALIEPLLIDYYEAEDWHRRAERGEL